MPTPTPPILAPYTSSSSSPAQSLTLITSVLGATSNWLVLRILCDALSAGEYEGWGGAAVGGRGAARGRKVVLVSFLRSWEFWRGEARRAGLDLARFSNEGSFVFVDGLSELFSGATSAPSAAALPIRSAPPVSSRQPAVTRLPAEQQQQQQQRAATPAATRKLHWSTKGGLDAVERDIISAIEERNPNVPADEVSAENDTLLIVDQPDLLLAATGAGQGVGAAEMGEFIMGLRQHSHSTIVTVSADAPLIHNSSPTERQPTPLETEHAALVVGLAHQARMVMQLRGLDTGVARDVSGVLRISKGGGWVARRVEDKNSSSGGDGHGDLEEREVLYFIQADGAVRVFGRGEMR
ncbi:hypothetical protein AJ80_01617 [Polytolypa hystricis UAMH7299]|uniref:Elongator complex protein 6 n=1 Tax=Polytolypa hystricis (strain UAMH7299) TaxID=1447883 RepID=A0A2B7Z029_POLH7|nr:hypothetical protein AJ80_01617 [Polytolypa hystricis UAMH7299]